MPALSRNRGNDKISSSGGSRTKLKLRDFYPPRFEDARKGDFGRVVVCGGSDRYAGCLAFNSLAALRAGADLSIVVAPRRAADIVAAYSPDLITVPCDTPFPDPDVAIDSLENADSLVLGCGIARTPESHKAVTEIIKRCKSPMVLDAEALHAIAPSPESVRGKKALLTPNSGEYRILSGEVWPSTLGARRSAVEELARRYDSAVIVKGAPDIVSDGRQTYVDSRGSSFMTKGGYGDLIAGVAGAHLARKAPPFDAGRVAAFIVGTAGELAASKFGESLLASDVLQFFPSVLLAGGAMVGRARTKVLS